MSNFRAVKVFGERNVGTNYLCDIIKLNLQVSLMRGAEPLWLQDCARKLHKYAAKLRIAELIHREELPRNAFFLLTGWRNLGWKHSMLPPIQRLEEDPRWLRIGILSLTKGPYSWLLSLKKKSYHMHPSHGRMDFSQFIRTRPDQQWRERIRTEINNPVQLWNEKNRSYMEAARSTKLKAFAQTYENLVLSPEESLVRIAKKLEIPRLSAEFVNQNQSTKANQGDGHKGFDYYQRYYSEHLWRADLSDDDIQFINSQLDPEVMDFFGYEIIS